MNGTTDERLDRIVEAVQQVNIHLEGLRVSLGTLVHVAEDHETRLRAVERWRHNLASTIAALTFLLGVVATEVVRRIM